MGALPDMIAVGTWAAGILSPVSENGLPSMPTRGEAVNVAPSPSVAGSSIVDA